MVWKCPSVYTKVVRMKGMCIFEVRAVDQM